MKIAWERHYNKKQIYTPVRTTKKRKSEEQLPGKENMKYRNYIETKNRFEVLNEEKEMTAMEKA